MLNLKNLKVLILEENNLLKLTTNSLDINNPEITYRVISKDKMLESRIATVLNNTDEITLVIKSGLIVNLKNKDLPSKSKLNKYHMAVSRYGVFTDHERIKQHYQYISEEINKKVLDLAIFIINPKKWKTAPEKDSGALRDKKLLYMPRYMNHKDDILFREESTAAIDAFNYGVLGEQALVHNYLNPIYRKNINILEIYAYCFDKLLPYLKGVPKKETDRITLLANKTLTKIKNTREKIHYVHHK
tara:strand:+ start:1378 stop:2112 length:735 start_codon:yes stop_codon:yes gene_type:complete